MSLTPRDIIIFAQDAVRDGYRSGPDTRTEPFRRSYLDTPVSHRRAAIVCFDAAQQAVRDSGYRVTQRVKDGIWAELERISLEAFALPKLAA